MPRGTVLFLSLFAVLALLCLGANVCYAILVDEVQRRNPDDHQIRFPFASWNVFTVARLQQRFYPVSRVRFVYRLTIGLAITCFASIAIIMAAFAFSNPPR